MAASSLSFDNQPLRYYQGRAIYLTAYLTLGLTVGIVVTLLLMSAGASPIFLIFSPDYFLHGRIWQPLTYVLVNPINFFTPMSLLCFYAWGVEIEKYLGRRRFLAICGALLACPVAIGLLLYPLGLVIPTGGDYLLICGLLVAFATLYPDMDYLGGWIPLKWFAFVMIACGSLMHFPEHDWIGLGMLWLNCFIGYASIQFTRGHFNFPKIAIPSFARKPKFRVLPNPTPSGVQSSYDEPESDVDALLDKIARSGMPSLTKAERDRLESARQDLLKKTE